MSNICFNHSGNLGDILYSLHFCIEYLEYLKIPVTMCDFNLQINQEGDRTNNHPYGKYLMTDDAANFLLPLLKIIGFKQITISEKCPENAFDLSLFRKLMLNFAPSDLRNLYYQLIGNHLPQDYSRKLFNISGRFNELNNKILFSYTKRYQNPFINYKELERFKDSLLFIGLKDEYEYFIKNYF